MTYWKHKLLSGRKIQRKTYSMNKNVKGFTWEGDVLIETSILKHNRHDPLWKNSEFYDRSLLKYTTTGIETLMTEKKLKQAFREYSVGKKSTILELGCGDGRLTRLLLKMGQQKIVAVDYEINSIRALGRRLKKKDDDRVFRIASDVNRLPLKSHSFDLVLAWGVLTSTSNFEKSLASALSHLKPGGLLITAEPLLEHCLLYALIRRDLKEFQKIMQTSTRAAMWENKSKRYRVYTENEIDVMMRRSKIRILKKDGISIYPSLIFGGLFQEKATNKKKKQECLNAILELDQKNHQSYRQLIYYGRKNKKRHRAQSKRK